MRPPREVLVSVDIETSGPIPGEYSMLTIGACAIDDPDVSFACSIKPITDRADPEALRVTGLSMEELAKIGLPPVQAMQDFEKWLASVTAADGAPVFVGFNAPFDWSFVNYYFHRFLGRNPFGFTAIDIKAFYLGVTGCSWSNTRSSAIARELRPALAGDHNALHDARYQAELFRLTRQLGEKIRSAGKE